MFPVDLIESVVLVLAANISKWSHVLGLTVTDASKRQIGKFHRPLYDLVIIIISLWNLWIRFRSDIPDDDVPSLCVGRKRHSTLLSYNLNRFHLLYDHNSNMPGEKRVSRD